MHAAGIAALIRAMPEPTAQDIAAIAAATASASTRVRGLFCREREQLIESFDDAHDLAIDFAPKLEHEPDDWDSAHYDGHVDAVRQAARVCVAMRVLR